MSVDPRSARALELTETASTWRRLITRDGEPIVAMPSQTHGSKLFYLVTETSCTCEDWKRRGLSQFRIGEDGVHCLCKHILALHFSNLMQAEQQEAEYAF